MNLSLLAGKPVNAYGGFSTDCSCFSRHAYDTVTSFGEGAEEGLIPLVAAIIPEGCAALIVFEKGFDTSDLRRLLRRAGYGVYETEIEKNTEAVQLEKVSPQDGVRLLIGFGGGFACDCAKYMGAFFSLPVALVVRTPTSCSYSLPSALISSADMPELFKTPPPKLIVCDTKKLEDKDAYIACGFGALVSRLTALFDWKFNALIRGEKLCKAIYESTLREIDCVLSLLNGIQRGDRGLKEIVTEACLKVSALCAMTGSSALVNGSDSACALALSKLFRHEHRPLKLEGENQFLFSLILMRMFEKTLVSFGKTGFKAPPDINKRLEKITEFLGVAETDAAARMSRYPLKEEIALYDYRMGEYKEELLYELKSLKNRLKTAHKIFKRLYGDDGFSLTDYLQEGDAETAIAFAPDMTKKYTFVTHMQNMGLTDVYLLD